MSDALSWRRATPHPPDLLPSVHERRFRRPPLNDRQKRFGHDVDGYLRLFEALHARQDPTLRVGCALHSLRAVPADAMHAVLAALPDDVRIHIHIAEQIGEVQDCIAVRNARPVEWLLGNAAVDARWTLVHATHLDDAEIAGIARSAATVALCPTTEANLATACSRCARTRRRRRMGHRLGLAHLGVAGGVNCAGWNTASGWRRAIAT